MGPMLTYCQSDIMEHISKEFHIKLEVFIKEIAFENVSCKMSDIFSQPQNLNCGHVTPDQVARVQTAQVAPNVIVKLPSGGQKRQPRTPFIGEKLGKIIWQMQSDIKDKKWNELQQKYA